MREPRNRVVQVRRFGGPDGLEVVNAPLPRAGLGEVRVSVLASSVQYTDVLIRRRLYPQTAAAAPHRNAMVGAACSSFDSERCNCCAHHPT